MKITQILEALAKIEATEESDAIVIPRGETTILQAEGNDYKRGLRVTLLEEGGYEIQYWYEDPSASYPIEMLVDGVSIKKDANTVTLLFHPELKK